MPNMVPDDVIQITYRGLIAAQRILIVLHARCVGTGGVPTDELFVSADIANKLADPTDARLIDLLACVGPEYSISEVRVQKVKPYRTVYMASAGGGIGTYAGSSKTPNVAASIEKQSTHVGRSGVGRIQLAGIPTAAYNGGILDPVYKAGVLNNFAMRMSGSFSGGPLYPGYTFSWCLPAGGPDHTYDVYSTIIQDQVRTMHRRTVGLGI